MPVTALFDRTLNAHPDWWCPRASINPLKPKQWKSYFIEFPYRDIEPLNLQWQLQDAPETIRAICHSKLG